MPHVDGAANGVPSAGKAVADDNDKLGHEMVELDAGWTESKMSSEKVEDKRNTEPKSVHFSEDMNSEIRTPRVLRSRKVVSDDKRTKATWTPRKLRSGKVIGGWTENMISLLDVKEM